MDCHPDDAVGAERESIESASGRMAGVRAGVATPGIAKEGGCDELVMARCR
jgi:hypothetical protein